MTVVIILKLFSFVKGETMSIFVDIHVLQTLPPSNPNRDDTGAPKTAMFGGVRRMRALPS